MKKGFTLTDLLVSLSILIIALLPIALMIAGSMGYSRYGALVIGRRQKNKSICLSLAKKILDDHKSKLDSDYLSISTGIGGPYEFDDHPGFYYSTEIFERIDYGGYTNRIKSIKVTVWKEELGGVTYPPHSEEDQVTLDSLVANKSTW